MGKLGLLLLILLMCEMSNSSVKLNVWFLLDFEPVNEYLVVADVVWRNLVRSRLLPGKLASYTVVRGTCHLQGVRQMMRGFTTKHISKVHAFIGPTCGYMCDLTGMMSSAYSIPQVSGFYRAMHYSAKRDLAITCSLSVRLSVCLSVTLVDHDRIGEKSRVGLGCFRSCAISSSLGVPF